MKYIKVERSDMAGGYTQEAKQLANAIDGEFDDIQDIEPGTTITLTVVEMTPEEYEALPEFEGW